MPPLSGEFESVFRTLMSKNALATGCPICGGAVTKEAYLGGAVYYCPRCQPEHNEKR